MLDKINPCDSASGKIGDLIYDWLIKPVGWGTKCHCCIHLRWLAIGIIIGIIIGYSIGNK